jgi:hypothetical protein
MITNTPYKTNDFIYSLTYQGPHETTVYLNDNTGYYRSHIYMIEGEIDAYESNTETPSDLDLMIKTKLVRGTLYDSSHTKGKYIIAKTLENGAAMVMINPVPADRRMDVEILKDKQTIEINATDKKITIICLTGPIDVNGKTLKTTQYAVVLQNKSATITMEDNTICALVTDTDV